MEDTWGWSLWKVVLAVLLALGCWRLVCWVFEEGLFFISALLSSAAP